MGRTAVSEVRSSPGFVRRRAPLEVHVKIPLDKQVLFHWALKGVMWDIHTLMMRQAPHIVDRPLA